MIILFFVLAFGITWVLQLPAVLASQGLIGGPPEKFMPLVGLGAFGPTFAAMICARVAKTGIKALFGRLAIKTHIGWYALALLIPAALYTVGAFIFNLLGHSEPLAYPANTAPFLIAAVFFPLGEEVGWRGYALPQLLGRTSPLVASAIVGVLWALWHIPMLSLQGVQTMLYVLFIPYMVAASVFFTWLFKHSNGSLLAAVLGHMGVHLNNPGHTMSERTLPMVIQTITITSLAIALVVSDRPVWRRATT